VKFTRENGGRVCLRAQTGTATADQHSDKTRPLRNEVEISVVDTGIGIHPEDADKIFEPFLQLENSISRKYSGTGLGLYLSRKLVELHGGRIWMESEGLGKGSAFRFTLPA
jgi:signal transduction histidine kinase